MHFIYGLANGNSFEAKRLYGSFSSNFISNFHNNHFEEKKIHMLSRFQEQLRVNVWAGIVGDNLLGLFFPTSNAKRAILLPIYRS